MICNKDALPVAAAHPTERLFVHYLQIEVEFGSSATMATE